MNRSSRAGNGFSLIELLLVIAIGGVLGGLALSATNRSTEKARLAKCQNQFHQFHAIAVMYAEENSGWLRSYGDFLKQTPMVCPSDKSLGATGASAYKSPTSFSASPFVFSSNTRWDECQPNSWMLTEYHPYHDLSKKPGFESGKWVGRFNSLWVDGTTHWERLEQ